MDEDISKILEEYIDRCISERLHQHGRTIAGLEMLFITLVVRLHQAGVVPAQEIQGDLAKLAELFSGDPENGVLPQMARQISQTIDLALGNTPPPRRQ